ncbi:MAG: thiamine diphosphokinase [Bacteroidales bacterium]
MLVKEFDCVILANGEFPQSDITRSYLQQAPYLIACDGAVNKLLDCNLKPDAIVGDLDSISQERLDLFADIIHHNPDQETNDLTKSALFARKAGFTKILILGATGLREDHTLANISLLTLYKGMFENVYLVSDYGTFIPITKTTTIATYPGQQVSIFALFPYGTITSEGLRYPVAERQLPLWWEGTLNEALGDSFTLQLSGEGNVLVYLRH